YTNQDINQILASLTPQQARELGISLSSDPRVAAQQLLSVKEVLNRFVELRRGEITTVVKPSLTKEQEDLFKQLADEFGFNQAEITNLQNGIDTLTILSRDPGEFVDSLNLEDARRYLGVSFRTSDQETELARLKSLLKKYIE